MERNNNLSQGRRAEYECARYFLSWYNRRYGSDFVFVRAEEFFPQLANRTRWEFVASQRHASEGWLAVEVKRLIRPQAEKTFSWWRKLVEDVNSDLDNLLEGEFIVTNPPVLFVNGRDRTRLKKVIGDSILKAAGKLNCDDPVDLGPIIAERLPSWPVLSSSSNPGYPHNMQLIKLTEKGHSVELGTGAMDIFWTHHAEEEAIDKLLAQDRDEIEGANRQLGLSRELGARSTILLLDCRLSYRPTIVRQIIADKYASVMYNIDSTYLVEASQRRVARVWPPDEC